MERDAFIIVCEECGVKNRVKAYSADRVPVCAKCRRPLVDEAENEAHARYSQKLKEFYNLPDVHSWKDQ